MLFFIRSYIQKVLLEWEFIFFLSTHNCIHARVLKWKIFVSYLFFMFSTYEEKLYFKKTRYLKNKKPTKKKNNFPNLNRARNNFRDIIYLKKAQFIWSEPRVHINSSICESHDTSNPRQFQLAPMCKQRKLKQRVCNKSAPQPCVGLLNDRRILTKLRRFLCQSLFLSLFRREAFKTSILFSRRRYLGLASSSSLAVFISHGIEDFWSLLLASSFHGTCLHAPINIEFLALRNCKFTLAIVA